MKINNSSTKVSAYLIYTYASISAFLLMVVNKITANLDSTEKAINFSPILSVIIVLNMATLVSFYYYRKNLANK